MGMPISKPKDKLVQRKKLKDETNTELNIFLSWIMPTIGTDRGKTTGELPWRKKWQLVAIREETNRITQSVGRDPFCMLWIYSVFTTKFNRSRRLRVLEWPGRLVLDGPQVLLTRQDYVAPAYTLTPKHSLPTSGHPACLFHPDFLMLVTPEKADCFRHSSGKMH